MPDFARPGLNTGDEVGDLGVLIELLRKRPAWHADALCKEYPEVDFFPERGGDFQTPREICRRCLVVGECAAWALEQGSLLSGIWGGMTQRERTRPREGPRRPPRLARGDRGRRLRGATKEVMRRVH